MYTERKLSPKYSIFSVYSFTMAVYVTRAMLTKFHRSEFVLPTVYDEVEPSTSGDGDLWHKIASDR